MYKLLKRSLAFMLVVAVSLALSVAAAAATPTAANAQIDYENETVYITPGLQYAIVKGIKPPTKWLDAYGSLSIAKSIPKAVKNNVELQDKDKVHIYVKEKGVTAVSGTGKDAAFIPGTYFDQPIHQRPMLDKKAYAYDGITQTISAVDGSEPADGLQYKIGAFGWVDSGSDDELIVAGEEISFYGITQPVKVQLREKATASAPASLPITISVPASKKAPSAKYDQVKDTLKGANNKMQYAFNPAALDAEWKPLDPKHVTRSDIASDTNIPGVTDINDGYTVYVRIAKTTKAPASQIATVVFPPVSDVAPAGVTAVKDDKGKVKISGVTKQMEYTFYGGAVKEKWTAGKDAAIETKIPVGAEGIRVRFKGIPAKGAIPASAPSAIAGFTFTT